MCVGRRPDQGKLSKGQIPSSALSARGKKAIGAITASILTAAYHMLKNGSFYADLGTDSFDPRAKTKQVHRLIGRLQNLGFAVQIPPMQADA
jgi:transposase